MTKKHFKAIAAAVRQARIATSYTGDADFVINEVVQRLADVFQAENPRFDRSKFVEACRV